MIGQTGPCQTSFLTHGSNHTPKPMQTSRTARTLAAIAQLTALTLLLTLSSIMGFAQGTSTGTVVGTVTDPQGAVVPGADVSLTDKSTNTTSKTVANGSGHFIFVNVTPGTYDIKINKSGFQTALVRDQNVQVGQTLTEDVKLPVGSVTQEVTVETTGTELQTLNSTVGNTVNGVALDSLPSLGRDVNTFVTLQPGISPDGSVAGAVVDQSTFQLDGGNNTNDMDGAMNVYTPTFAGDPTGIQAHIGATTSLAPSPTGVMPTPADSVEEFKVNTANQTADFNSSSGAQIQVVTKRGTSKFHGTVYEYYLDNNWNANSWDNNLTGTPLPPYHYSRFGGALGGPLLPKEVLGGKTYFFVNYQGFRWPNIQTIERAVPTADMRNGFLTFGKTRYDTKTLDPRGIGIDPLVQQMWSKYMPLPNDPTCGTLLGSRCDKANVAGFKTNLTTPQNDNFGVIRLDHDFGSKWHLMGSYRYYKLTRSTSNQIDIGGFFPGDKLGVATPVSTRPQVPWYYVAGLTTNITSNVTNDFHYSFLRNWWAYQSKNDPPQFAGLGGALEPLGEQHFNVLAPYNVDNQNTRARFWDGKDHFLRDDLSMLHGNHLFQFGGQYQHNFNWHQRSDNGGTINFNTVYQLGDSIGAGSLQSDISTVLPAGFSGSKSGFGRDLSAVLGIVTDSQLAYTRVGKNMQLNPPGTFANAKVNIPYYNVYFSDTWHMKPSFTLTYGLGWALEMPPTEENGAQVTLVGANNQQIDVESYLAQRQAAALAGQVYNPTVGFALVGNTANGGLKYPYQPFYGGFSPRVAVAWNPAGSNTVIRGGYGRVYGRLNGVNQVLVPLLAPGLIQTVDCQTAQLDGTCPGALPSDPFKTAFRIGVDGNTAPLASASANLPQPYFPGINDVSTAAGESLDPHMRPNAVDSFDFTVQRQLSNRVTVEAGYIGRWVHNEFLPININAVPTMMTLGGQTFAKAYAAVETAMGCTKSVAACDANGPPTTMTPQPFFEAALKGTGYCNGFSSCTAAVVTNEESNFAVQNVWSLWSDLDTGGTSPGFNFPVSMLNSPISGPFGANGQLTSGNGVNASLGFGNYNAGFLSIKMNDWHGLTTQSNFTWSKAMGTNGVVQASSELTADDPFNIKTMYGLQPFDRKFVYNIFLVYQPPFYKGQSGLLGHLLGGWNIAPVFTAGSGLPLYCNTSTDAQGFGAGDGNSFFDNEQCQFNNASTGGNSAHLNVAGGKDSAGNEVGTAVAGSGNTAINIFGNPVAVWNQVRPPILGFDTRDAGSGPTRGLSYWNMDLSLKKTFRITERVNTELQAVFTNVLNHNQLADPTLDISNPSSWGVITTQANTPRQMEFGLRVSF
jgi:hypothetical protein